MNLIYIEDSIKLKIFVLKIMESFVYSGRDETYQNLGAMYVLGALTIVNENAASALPWLYESFAVIGNNPDSNNWFNKNNWFNENILDNLNLDLLSFSINNNK